MRTTARFTQRLTASSFQFNAHQRPCASKSALSAALDQGSRHALTFRHNSTVASSLDAPSSVTFKPPSKRAKEFSGRITERAYFDRDALARQDERERRTRDQFGTLSASAKALHSDILSGKVNVATHIQQSTLKGNELLEVIRTCVDAEKLRIFTFPRDQRATHLQSGFARAILDRMWSDNDIWHPILQYDPVLLANLCYFCEAEGLTPLVLEWLEISDPRDLDSDKSRFIWRGHLVSSIVSAQLMWNTTSSANTAIETFFHVVHLKRRYRALYEGSGDDTLGVVTHIPTRHASNVLADRLMTSYTSNTSAEMFDSFVRFYTGSQRHKQWPEKLDFFLAAFSLRHPSNPSPDKAYDFLRHHFPSEDQERINEASSKLLITKEKVKAFCSRTRYLLSKDNRNAEAKWVAAIAPKIISTKQNARRGTRASTLLDNIKVASKASER